MPYWRTPKRDMTGVAVALAIHPAFDQPSSPFALMAHQAVPARQPWMMMALARGVTATTEKPVPGPERRLRLPVVTAALSASAAGARATAPPQPSTTRLPPLVVALGLGAP